MDQTGACRGRNGGARQELGVAEVDVRDRTGMGYAGAHNMQPDDKADTCQRVAGTAGRQMEGGVEYRHLWRPGAEGRQPVGRHQTLPHYQGAIRPPKHPAEATKTKGAAQEL